MQRWKATYRNGTLAFRCGIGRVLVSGGVVRLYSDCGTFIGLGITPDMPVAKFLSCAEHIISHTKNTYRI